ncbi:MAG TPA: AAA family ATPase [Clostridiales bacterium]|nr:MAG: AAA family ATPase [Clostridiales bacterium GWD2_32_59]HAN09556.1 AAA family ATPase [Clostridiales bacterium]
MREFNIAGVCIPDMHYMVEISDKIKTIKKLVDGGKYFTINRARQYGKTTTMFMLQKELTNEYAVISTSFEGIGGDIFKEEREFSSQVLKTFSDDTRFVDKELAEEIKRVNQNITSLGDLSNAITELCLNSKKKIVLMIDKVDKSSDNQIFLHFIGMLRNKYLDRNMKKDYTFYSVILAGVHDVKNLKLKLRPDEERKYNSPWNIAVDFNVDMSFNPKEISTMLVEYEKDHNTGMNIGGISEEIYSYTSGYPFLASKICKLMDENLDKKFTSEGLQEAVKTILNEKNTLFDDLIKNLENNKELYDSVYNQLILGQEYTFNIDNSTTSIGSMFGIFRQQNGKRVIHNKIFEQRIYAYLSSNLEEKENMDGYNFRDNFITEKGELNVERILERFQLMMKEEYSDRDKTFLERQGRLLFIAFLRPVINGVGFALKEVQISQEQRLDILVTYGKKKYVIELKKWYGEEYHKKGLEQLERYITSQGVEEGYLIIFNLNKDKKYTNDVREVNGKRIYEVVV